MLFRSFIRACAAGGLGGAASATMPGGGGGAGESLEIEEWLEPLSIISVGWDAIKMSMSYLPKNAVSYVTIRLRNGGIGGAAGAGPGSGGPAGGAAINGGAAQNPYDERCVPGCYVDADGYAHTTGGFAGYTGATVPASNGGYAVQRETVFNGGVVTDTVLRRVPLKYPMGISTVTGQGGQGGSSALGAGQARVSAGFDPGFGGGGAGQDVGGALAAVAGDGLFSIAWNFDNFYDPRG